MGMIRTTIWLIALCTLQACGVRAPITQFNSANVTNSTPEAISITAHFDVSNTNDEPLRLEKYKYYVTVDGRTVYQGLAAAELTVPRLSSISSSIPIVIRREEIGAQSVIAWKLSGSLSYIPPTALAETLLKNGFWEPTSSIRAHGAIDVPVIE
tara:strand:+ start:1529 stop:1990 length:462 start_codon:yes stop_codon:yes gene_type:complete